MGALREKQSVFCRKISVLKLVAFELGYELTEGDSYRDPRVSYGHPNSCHRIRLASDLNVFMDGRYLQGEEAAKAHAQIHDIWDQMGGAKRIKHDLNHYSIEHNGMR